MKLVLGVLYFIGLYSAYLAGSLYLRTRSRYADHSSEPSARRTPYATLLLALAVAIPTTLQFSVPALLPMFERDYTKFLQGEWWRLVTSLFVQDGGLSGSIFNLVSLLLMGMVAEELWDSPKWLILFFGGGILSQVVAFAWQPVGAGTSVANFSVAGGTAVLCLASDAPRPIKVMSFLTLAFGGIFIFLKDIHGPAVMFGALIALLVLQLDRHRIKKQL